MILRATTYLLKTEVEDINKNVQWLTNGRIRKLKEEENFLNNVAPDRLTLLEIINLSVDYDLLDFKMRSKIEVTN